MALAKKAKHKKHEEHADESWLLPYSDLLTLLLALFIVLFASSSIDAEKLQRLSAAFNMVFEGGSGVLEQPSPIPTENPKSDGEAQSSAYVEDQAALSEINNRVENFIAVNELENQFETKLTDEGLLVTIRDSVLFDPGKADVKSEYLTMASELSEILVFDPERSVIVTGHTDNIPMNNDEFSSNWELSVMRAVNFLKIMIDSNPNLDPLYFSAKGYGEYRPIATNDTVEGRAQNRRVEVLIQPRILEDGSETNDIN